MMVTRLEADHYDDDQATIFLFCFRKIFFPKSMPEGAKKKFKKKVKSRLYKLSHIFFIVRNPCIHSVAYTDILSYDWIVCTRNVSLPCLKTFKH